MTHEVQPSVAFDPARVIEIIREIETGQAPLETISDDIKGKNGGKSGRKFRSLTQALVREMPADLLYLEIGIWQGLTPIVTAAGNPGKTVIGVDDFSQFDKDGVNHAKIMATKEDLSLDNLHIHQGEFEEYLKANRDALKGKVGVYFFDACHDYRSQMIALQHAAQIMAPGGVIMVDDCNYAHVRQATADLIDVHPDYKLIFEAYTGLHPNRRNGDALARIREGWWNGVHVILHDPESRVEGLYPPLPKDLRQKFIAQHGFAGCNSNGAPTRFATQAQAATG